MATARAGWETKSMILVTGATGNIGRELVADLTKATRVRVLARDPSKVRADADVVQGDLDRPDTVAAALAGIERAFMLAMSPQQELDFIAAAEEAGVQHLVMLSSGGVPYGVASGPMHAPGEARLQASRMAWTILRPWEFMSNALRWAPTIRSQATVYDPSGDGLTALIHPGDIARAAAAVLTSAGHEGKIYDLTGPRAIGRREMVATLGEAIGKPLRYVDLPLATFEEQMAGMGAPPPMIASVAGFYRMVREGKLTDVKPDLEAITGRPGRTFAAWVDEHRAAFA